MDMEEFNKKQTDVLMKSYILCMAMINLEKERWKLLQKLSTPWWLR